MLACTDANAIREWITILFGGAAIIIAYLGLHTWREQLHGSKQWEAASNLLRVAYKLNNLAQLITRDIHNGKKWAEKEINSNVWQSVLNSRLDVYKEQLSECSDELYDVKSDVAVYLSPFLGQHTSALMRLANSMAKQINYISTGLTQSLEKPDDSLHLSMTNEAINVANNADYGRDFSRIISALEHDLDPYLPKSRKFSSLKPIEKWPEFESEKAANYFSEYN